MRVYLDESGDTGWKLDAPFRHGGSSRFLCLALLFLPVKHRKLPAGIIAGMYKRYAWTSEQKACRCTRMQKLEVVSFSNAMLEANSDIKIDCIVVNKEKVLPHIRNDPNKLYNYMCKLVIQDHAKRIPDFEFIPDKRSIKVESGNSLSDYLQTVLWFDFGLKTTLTNNPQESARNYNLQFVDWIANIVWKHFEDGETVVYNELQKKIRIRRLFF